MLLLLSLWGLFYLRRDYYDNFLYYVVIVWTFIERHMGSLYRAYRGKKLRIDKVYHYTGPTIRKLNPDSFMVEDGTLVVFYEWNNNRYIDIVNGERLQDYNIEKSLGLVRRNNVESSVSACSMTVASKGAVLYDEEDITSLFISLLHNSIIGMLSLEEISLVLFIVYELEVGRDYNFTLSVVDKNGELFEVTKGQYVHVVKGDIYVLEDTEE